MTSQEMMRMKCKPGYWFVNISPMGEMPNWVIEIAPHQEKQNQLFGYDVDVFMAKQYKPDTL